MFRNYQETNDSYPENQQKGKRKEGPIEVIMIVVTRCNETDREEERKKKT